MREQHFELCRMAEQCDNNPGLAWYLQKSACSTGNCIQSTLGLTCKTHKPRGMVKHRNIHCSAIYLAAGISTWFASQLREIINSLEHLVKDGGHFTRRIESLKVTYIPIIMKLDVDHYYLSGQAHELVRDAQLRRHFGTDKGVLMERILWYLLGNQFVVSQTIGSHRAWRVNLGTGMGLIHSGELADIIFYNKVE